MDTRLRLDPIHPQRVWHGRVGDYDGFMWFDLPAPIIKMEERPATQSIYFLCADGYAYEFTGRDLDDGRIRKVIRSEAFEPELRVPAGL